jgi:hypothetical protein
MPLTLPAEAPAPYIHLDNRALIISNGTRSVMFNRTQDRWVSETLKIIDDEKRATRSQSHHVLGGYVTDAGVLIYAGLDSDLLSVQITQEAFDALRGELTPR